MSSAVKLDLELLGLSDSWTSWLLSEPFSDRVACLGRSTRVPFKKLCWKVWLAFLQMHFYLKTVTCCELLGFSYTLWHPSKWSGNGRNYFVFNCSNLLLFPWDRKVKIMTFWEICAFDFVAVFYDFIYTIGCAHMSWHFKSLVHRYVWTEILRTDVKAQRIFLLHAYITPENCQDDIFWAKVSPDRIRIILNNQGLLRLALVLFLLLHDEQGTLPNRIDLLFCISCWKIKKCYFLTF